MTTRQTGHSGQVGNGSGLAPIENPRLVDVTTAAVRMAIIKGELAPGERLVENSLAADLGISRGPLREALQILEREGLVVTLPRRGRFVQSTDVRTLDEVYSLRRVLEPFAAERALSIWDDSAYRELKSAIDQLDAARRSESPRLVAECDIEFHTTMIRLADHRLLWRTWNDSVAGNLHLLLNVTTATHQSLDEPVLTHAKILDLLVAGDEVGLRAEIQDHIDDGLRRMRLAFPLSSVDLDPQQGAVPGS